MSTMIERVARAIGGVAMDSPVDEAGDRWRNWEADARAAIEAMREPTAAMISAGSRQRPFNEDDTDYDGFAYRENTAIRLSGLEPQSNAPALKSISKVDRLTP